MFGWLFKKKYDPDLLGLIEMLKVKIVEMSKEIDMINEKLHSPLIKKKLKDEQERKDKALEEDCGDDKISSSDSGADSGIRDGFDGIRKLRKDLSMSSS